MSEQALKIIQITQRLESGLCLTEALFFPEMSHLVETADRDWRALEGKLHRVIEETALVAMHQRRLAGKPRVQELSVDVDPPKRRAGWTEAVSLRFHVLRWAHGEEAHLAFVPALGIEIIAAHEEDLEEMVRSHIRFALLRTEKTSSLRQLAQTQTCEELIVTERTLNAKIRTPKQWAEETDAGREKEKSVLAEAATDLTQSPLPAAYEMDDLVAQIAETLTGETPRSVLLVGPSGVGKTAAVYELVRSRAARQLGHTPFWETSGARVVAGMSGFGMWQDRCQKLCRETSKQRAVVHLGNLIELMQVGRSVFNNQGIASFLRPYIGRGDLLAIAECTPEQLTLAQRDDPHLVEVFAQIAVAEPSEAKGRAILTSVLLAASRRAGVALDDDGLDMLDRLHRRYATYSAYPGRPLRFLKNLVQDHVEKNALTGADVTTAFSRETGLPQFMIEDSATLDLDRTRAWFAERVMGQPEAVDLVVGLLAVVKARLARPRRPIASLLFIGPTGVGKTEMAKSLAEFLFGDKDRLVRFDMSEFAEPTSVQRLIGNTGGEGLLTSKVREQPFCVLLLDEFEKAHPLLFDLLLQVLGEGRLTDAAGRLADFSNAVIVMTSNLGAQSFRQGAIGFVNDPDARRDARAHFIGEVQKFLRPEMFNRIDRVVPFAPLDEATVLSIAGREIELVRQRDGVRLRHLALDIPNEIVRHLAATGFDPRYGARPLKRAIERQLLVPMAEGMNRYGESFALTAEVRLEDGAVKVKVRTQLDKDGEPILAFQSESAAAGWAVAWSRFRHRLYRIRRGTIFSAMESDVFRLEQLQKRSLKSRRKGSGDMNESARLPELKAMLEKLESLTARAIQFEDQTLLGLYENKPQDADHLKRELESIEKELGELLYRVYAARAGRSRFITMGVFSEDKTALFELAKGYFDVAIRKKDHIVVEQVTASRVGRKAGRGITRANVEKHEQFFESPPDGVLGVIFRFGGDEAMLRYEHEAGLHVFKDGKREAECLVDAKSSLLLDYDPPAGIERRGGISGSQTRRTYDRVAREVWDEHLGRHEWPRDRLAELLLYLIDTNLKRAIQTLFEGGAE